MQPALVSIYSLGLGFVIDVMVLMSVGVSIPSANLKLSILDIVAIAALGLHGLWSHSRRGSSRKLSYANVELTKPRVLNQLHGFLSFRRGEAVDRRGSSLCGIIM